MSPTILTTLRWGSLALAFGCFCGLVAALLHFINWARPSEDARMRAAARAAAKGRSQPRFGHLGSLMVAGAWSGAAGWQAYVLWAPPGLHHGLFFNIWLCASWAACVLGCINAWASRSQV
jgi:hypothetical protein